MNIGAEPAFFESIGIANIVWLDDLFDARTTPNEADIAEAIGTAIARGVTPAHPKLADLTAGDTPAVWVRHVQERLDEGERSACLAQLRPREGGETRPETDYSQAEIETVVESLGGTIRRVGLSEWPSVKDDLVGSSKGGIFLVDLEKVVEGERINVGNEIVLELDQAM